MGERSCLKTEGAWNGFWAAKGAVSWGFFEECISSRNTEKELKGDFIDRGLGYAKLGNLRRGSGAGRACLINESKIPEKDDEELLETGV